MRRAGFRLFERALNVDTGGEVELEDLNVDAPEREGYEGSGWIDLRRMLRRGEVGPQDVFVDLGAGKGKIVMLAARYPFARVTGVEISEDLNVIGRRNLAQGRYRQRAKDVELVTADIAEYQIPDDVTVAYIYNTVRGETFDRVIANLVASVDRRPRSMRVIYLNAQEHDRLMATGRFKLQRTAGRLRLRRDEAARSYIRMYELASANT